MLLLAASVAVSLASSTATVSPAAASLPTPGGRYIGTLRYGTACRGCNSRVRLTVADDRLSLLKPSSIAFDAQCSATSPGETPTRLGASTEAPIGTAIGRDGTFRWTERSGSTRVTVTGAFEQGGRVARGTLSYRPTVDQACALASIPFTAPLSGRPYRPRPGAVIHCPTPRRFVGLGIGAEPVHRGSGCTPAVAVAQEWSTRAACHSGPDRLRACTVAGQSCTPIDVGQLDALSGVACRNARNPNALIELIVRWGCHPTNDEIFTDAINLSCATATAVTRAWSRHDRCTEIFVVGAKCSPLAGWRCTATIADNEPAGTIASRCARTGRQREVVEITWALPP